MFKFIKRIMGLSGEYRKKLDRAYVLSFFESLASNVPICMLLYVLMTIINGSFGKNTIIIAFAGIFAGAAQRYPVVDGAVIPDLTGLAEHDAHAMVDEDATADSGAGVDFNAGQKAARVRDDTRNRLPILCPAPVRQTMDHHGVKARIGEDDLPAGMSRGVLLHDGRDEFTCVLKHGCISVGEARRAGRRFYCGRKRGGSQDGSSQAPVFEPLRSRLGRMIAAQMPRRRSISVCVRPLRPKSLRVIGIRNLGLAGSCTPQAGRL